MSRPRSRKSKTLPPYVMQRSGRYYFEPKGEMVERYGGRKSIPLGGTFTEMYMNYALLLQDFGPSKYGTFNTMSELIDRYVLEVTPKRPRRHSNVKLKERSSSKKYLGKCILH